MGEDSMRKLTIIFKDKSRVIYTIKNKVAWLPYFQRHSQQRIESAIMQQYPKKDNEPLILV